MKKDKDQEDQTEKVYTTLDAYISGFLKVREHNPEAFQEDNKVGWSFVASDKLFKDLDDYHNGATIEAARLIFAIKTLKSQIHTMRREKEEICVKEQEP